MPSAPATAQAEPFIGQLGLFGTNFCPRGWASASGQIMSIAANNALFALIGTTYGGDGQTTFALPDLRGRAPLHMGQGPGLSNYVMGQVGGQESVTLTTSQIPSHSHTATVHVARINANTQSPTNANFARAAGTTYDDTNANGTADVMNAGTVTNAAAGGSQPHPNRMPYLTLQWCIAVEGIFPPRN
ncbi:MAG: phage tail protein [Erythrobacter sp.]|nr:phage tail protein [Erythrobacter sp.]